MIFDLLRRFSRHRAGTVSIIGALTLPLLLGFVSLAGEFGYGLVVKVENQRTADLASFAAALAYSSTNSTTTMTSVAQNVAALNGIGASQTSVGLVSSPRTAGDMAVSVNILRNDVLLLAPILRSGSTLPVSSQADAQLAAAPSACILALSGSGTGVTLSGGTSVSAASCSVSSNATVSVPCGTSITAKSVSYNGTTPTQPCSGISGSLVKQTTADPLASNTAVTALQTHANSLSSLSAPGGPNVSTGTLLEFGYSNQSATQSALTAAGCSSSYANSGGSWTVTCPNGGTYTFAGIVVDGGVSVSFAAATTAATFNFGPSKSSGCNGGTFSICNTGSTLTFGGGTFNISRGIMTGGGTTTTFGAGTFNIGSATSSCSGSGGNFSVCNTGTTLTFGGPSTFVIAGGIYNTGGSTLTMGSGSTNRFNIGPSSSGYAVLVGGGAKTTFGDATGHGDLFQLVGNLSAPNGGTCMTISAAAQHDIDGYFSTAGGTALGAGVYSVYGYIAFGANGGGDVSCNGSTIGVSGTGVTLVMAGQSTVSGSSCTSAVFCEGAGFNNISLSAPTLGTDANLVIIGPSSATGGAYFSEGASNTLLSGALYFPKGPMALSGGASVGNQTGQCLQVIASQITLSGGTHLTSNSCISSSGSAQVELVQ